eukprot:3458747-Pyramimonas_sp.AAC.1
MSIICFGRGVCQLGALVGICACSPRRTRPSVAAAGPKGNASGRGAVRAGSSCPLRVDHHQHHE